MGLNLDTNSKMRYRVHFYTILIIAIVALEARAQDVHFSQIHATPMALNPAMTGVFEGTGRFIGNYRNQWKSVTADYKTFMFSGDMNISGPTSNSILGIGGLIYNDVAGDLDFTTNAAYGSVSVMQSFDGTGDHILSLGLQVGKVGNRFDPTKILAYDVEYELLQDGVNNLSYVDISAGMLWYMKFGGGEYLYLGGSMLHTNNPIVSFFAGTPDEQNALYRRFVFHGGANLNVSNNYTIIPNFIYMTQGPNRELTMGTFARMANRGAKADSPASFMLGAWFRAFAHNGAISADAIIGAMRIDYTNMSFTFSYDVNVSTLGHISAGRGGPEVSLMYTFGSHGLDRGGLKGNKPRRSGGKVKCPIW